MRGEWTTKTLRLKDKHAWKSRPGYSICAIDRGAIRFDYPNGWDVTPENDQINVRDKPEPLDNCVLGVSRLHLPLELADQVAVRQLVEASTQEDTREILDRKRVVDVPREDGIELAFGEVRYMDPKEKREAIGRLAIGRGSGVYCLITFDFWVDDAAKFEHVWAEAIRSLQLGTYVKDPTIGPGVQ